jgi:predicted HTH domain antitoxin
MLVIENQILEQADVSESQLLEDIAVMLYQKKRLTLGQAAQLAKLNYAQFQFLLGKNSIPTNYDVSELMEDVETIKKMNSKW